MSRDSGLVVGVAVLRYGRVLATRRTRPPSVRGFWELPGGKVEPDEPPEWAAVREVREELGCTERVTGRLAGEQPIDGRLRLRVLVAELVEGEPAPHEHDAIRWLHPEELDDVQWLAPDLPFLAELRELLLDGHRLEGGNVGGAVRVGRTVRRTSGAWTPAVHRLLEHLAEAGLRAVPQVLDDDRRGREVLTYLPGRVLDADAEPPTDAQLADVAGWARELHQAAEALCQEEPWRRFLDVGESTVLGHNDLAPYNVCFTGERLVGVFDWDLAGPSTPLLELAHLAWTAVPLFRAIPARDAAHRLELVASSYGGVTGREILDAVPPRVQLAVDGIRRAVAAGDERMRNLTLLGEPERTESALTELVQRVPATRRELGGLSGAVGAAE